MKVLLLGSGGREHALGWKLVASPSVTSLCSVPGNPGLADLGETFPSVDPTDRVAMLELASMVSPDLVVIGPEAPLAAGVSDALIDAGHSVFGPTRAGARLESSKAHAKSVMERAGVPTAAAWTFTHVDDAVSHLERHDGPYVVKADGLAAGKGVLVTDDRAAAVAWAEACFSGRFGDAGSTVVVEEHLDGEEVSVFAICAGRDALTLEPARDYKRIGDGDVGPNTGGMGAYSPVLDLPDGLVEWTESNVIVPVLSVLADEGIDYRGFLYVGLMLTAEGPKVLEFNCRLGDPETQPLMIRLEADLGLVLAAAAGGQLPAEPLEWSDDHAVNVVLATDGYPEAPKTGDVITGIDGLGDGVQIFHAGTARRGDDLITAGGRVLSVVGSADSRPLARKLAYEAVEQIQFSGKQYRTDMA